MSFFNDFPPESAQAVEGLAWLGYLETEVSKWGHRWVLRTLKADEELEAGLLAKEYQDTFSVAKANAWAHIAASIVSVDGDENFCPSIGPGSKQALRGKMNYITENWYWPVGEFLFGEYVQLLTRQADALEAIESLSHRSLRNFWPSQDSSKEQADSEETSTDSNSDSSPISPDTMKSLSDNEE